MNGNGEKIELGGLDSGIASLEMKVGFGVEFHEDVAGSTLRGCARWEIHLSDDGLGVVSHHAILVDRSVQVALLVLAEQEHFVDEPAPVTR